MEHPCGGIILECESIFWLMGLKHFFKFPIFMFQESVALANTILYGASPRIRTANNTILQLTFPILTHQLFDAVIFAETAQTDVEILVNFAEKG